MLHVGIDEAGYGPTLGPLAVAAAAAEVVDAGLLARELAALGVADSKRVHVSGDLAALERIALPAAAWLTGFQPDTAADLFALLGEAPADRNGVPWMDGADALLLPAAAGPLRRWTIEAAMPAGLSGRLLHPRQLNAARRRGVNRAAAELDAVRDLLAAIVPAPARPAAIACDRLGGRKRYTDLLAAAWPGLAIATEAEDDAVCRYRAGGTTSIAFLVGGETVEPLIAAASCVAKYARELHMLLLNRYWSGRLPWLAPTAGYPQDAKRWLHQLGKGQVAAWADDLVRT